MLIFFCSTSWFVVHREITRIRYKALFVCFVMQAVCQVNFGSIGDYYFRVKYNGSKSPAIWVLDHFSNWFIPVFDYLDPGICTQMKIPKHVTTGKRCEEEIFRIVFGFVATKRYISRTK